MPINFLMPMPNRSKDTREVENKEQTAFREFQKKEPTVPKRLDHFERDSLLNGLAPFLKLLDSLSKFSSLFRGVGSLLSISLVSLEIIQSLSSGLLLRLKYRVPFEWFAPCFQSPCPRISTETTDVENKEQTVRKE